MGCWHNDRAAGSRQRPSCSLTSPAAPTLSVGGVPLTLVYRHWLVKATHRRARVQQLPYLVCGPEGHALLVSLLLLAQRPGRRQSLRLSCALDPAHGGPITHTKAGARALVARLEKMPVWQMLDQWI